MPSTRWSPLNRRQQPERISMGSRAVTLRAGQSFFLPFPTLIDRNTPASFTSPRQPLWLKWEPEMTDDKLDEGMGPEPGSQTIPQVLCDLHLKDLHLRVGVFDTVLLNGESVSLTPLQNRLMRLFAAAPGKLIQKSALMDGLYPVKEQERPEPKIVDIFVCKIREALDAACPGGKSLIVTGWGRGYLLRNTDAVEHQVNTLPNLPEPWSHWVASKKENVVTSIKRGEVTVEQVLGHYPELSLEELQYWQTQFARFGRNGLRLKRELSCIA